MESVEDPIELYTFQTTVDEVGSGIGPIPFFTLIKLQNKFWVEHKLKPGDKVKVTIEKIGEVDQCPSPLESC